MIGADARRGEFERFAQVCIERVEGPLAVFRRDPPVVIGVEPVLVEARGIFDQRRIAALAHLVDDAGDVAADLDVAFAPVADDAREGPFETFLRCPQELHQRGAPLRAALARKASTSAATRGRS